MRRRSRALRVMRKLGRGLLLALVALVLLLIATLLLLRRPGGLDFLRRQVLAQTRSVLPGLSLERIEGDLTSTLTVSGLVLDDRFGGPAVRVARIALRYDLTRLMRGVIRVDSLELDRPELLVQPSRNGALNLSQLVVNSPVEEKASEPTSLRLELASLRIRGARVSIAGAAKPLVVDGLEVELGLKGGLRDAVLELRRVAARVKLPDGRQLQGTLEGRVALDARRLEVRTLVRVRGLTPSGELALELRAAGPHPRVELKTRIDAAGSGAVTVEGWAGIDERWRPRYALKASLVGLSLDELVPALRPTRLGLELELEGDGVPLQPGSRSKLALRMPPGVVRGLRVDGLTLHAATSDARWSLAQLEIKAAGGNVVVSGNGTLEHLDATARVDLPRLAALPAEVHKLGVPRLGGSVKLSARVVGPVKGPLTLRSTVRLRRIELAALRLGRAELSASFQGLAAAPAGRLGVLLEGLDPGDPRLRVDRARLEVKGHPHALHLSGDAQGPAVRARVAAEVTLAAGGRRIEVWLRQLALAGLGQTVTLKNQPRLAYGRSRVELGSARLGLLGGEVVVGGTFRPKGFPRLVATAKIEGVRPPGFPHAVEATVQARADRRQVQASVQGKVPSLGTRLELEARLPVRYPGAMPVPDLQRDGELRLRLSEVKLGLLRALRRGLPAMAGSASLALDVSGPLRDPRAQLALEVANAGVGAIRGVGGTTQVIVAEGRTTVRQRVWIGGQPLLTLDAAVPLGLGALLQGRASLESLRELPLDLHLRVLPTRIASLPRVHRVLQQIAGVVSARVDLSGVLARPKLEVQTRLASGVVSGVKLGDLDVGQQVTAGDKDVRVSLEVQRDRRTLLVAQGTAGLQLGALLRRWPAAKRLWPRVPVDLVVRLPDYPLDRLASLGVGLDNLRGTLTGKVHVWGEARAPEARATVQLGRVGYAQVNVGDLSLGASFDGKQLETSLALRQPEGGQLRGSARLPLFSGQGLDGFVRGQRLDLAFLSQLTPAIRESAGKLSLDVKAQGSLDRPVLTGQVALEDARLRLRGVSLLHHLRARVDLEPDRVRLTSLSVQGDRGQLELSGQVALSGRGLELSRGPDLLRRAELLARAKGFGLDAKGMTGVVFSGAVKVDAQRQRNTLVLKVAVEDGVVKMPKIEGQRKTHATALPADVVFVDGPGPGATRATSAASPPSPLGLELELRADPLFVRGEELDLELANRLRVRTDRRGRPRISGKVQIRRGRIRVLKNTFEVRRATVSLSGEVDPDPALDILLERTAPEALVLVQVSGTARVPELSLRSDPPIYDQSQIISLLLTGRVDSRAGSGGDQTMAIASAISQVLLGSILQRVVPRVGIDVARVSFDETKDQKTGESQLRAEAEVGKYLTERIYVGYRRVFGASAQENTNEGLMEYRISAHWLLMALFGDAGVGGLDLLWNLRH